jgi:hypothetical protein
MGLKTDLAHLAPEHPQLVGKNHNLERLSLSRAQGPHDAGVADVQRMD